MTSSNGNILCVIDPLWGESTGLRWLPLTKASDAEIWYFLWSAPEQTAEQTIERMMICDAVLLIMTSPWYVRIVSLTLGQPFYASKITPKDMVYIGRYSVPKHTTKHKHNDAWFSGYTENSKITFSALLPQHLLLTTSKIINTQNFNTRVVCQ